MTAQGSPATRFARAIERRSLLNAELAAREMDQVSLEQALQLVILYERGKKLLKKTNANMFGKETEETGYQVLRKKNGIMELEWVRMPTQPEWRVFDWSPYDRSFGFTSHASQRGVLAHPEINREISIRRVERYHGVMKDGEWRDLLSDPISVTWEGHVINGQHRLAAASDTD